MFTGIVQGMGKVAAVERNDFGVRLTVEKGGWRPEGQYTPKRGDSISINGVCLTIAEHPGAGGDAMTFDVIAETLDQTTLGSLSVGDEVNLEHSLLAGQPLGGHIVQGHVDGVGEVVEVRAGDDEWRITVKPPQVMHDYIVPKGSITIDGVSLTIAAVRDSRDFEMALIPTTLSLTTLGKARPGTRVNLESDIISRTVVHHLRQRQKGGGVTMDDLRAAGFVE